MIHKYLYRMPKIFVLYYRKSEINHPVNITERIVY